jgi:hypothetical protein
MGYKGHTFLYECDVDIRHVTLIHNPSGVTLSQTTSVFVPYSEIEQILNELIKKAELMVIRNDNAFFS